MQLIFSSIPSTPQFHYEKIISPLFFVRATPIHFQLYPYLYAMNKQVKIYKPSDDEILRNVLQSFEIENIRITFSVAKTIFNKVLNKIKKANG